MIGVRKKRGRWQAYGFARNEFFHIGMFDDEGSAGAARVRWAPPPLISPRLTALREVCADPERRFRLASQIQNAESALGRFTNP